MKESIDPVLASPSSQALATSDSEAPGSLPLNSSATADLPTSPTAASVSPHHRAVAAHHHHHHHHGLLPALQSLFYIIVTAVFIITFIVQPFRIPSGSMEPSLLVGDFLLVDKQAAGPGDADGILPSTVVHRGDIIIFHYPVDPAIHLIKRVVGLPGDHVRLHDRHVYINGQPITEDYAVYRPSNPDNFRDNFPHLQFANPDINPKWWIKMHSLIDHGELVIPSGNYFVLGDNRNDSEDSRYWGLVPRATIVGKPVVIYFSLHQAGDGLLPDPQSANFPSAPTRPTASRTQGILNFARWHRIFHVVH